MRAEYSSGEARKAKRPSRPVARPAGAPAAREAKVGKVEINIPLVTWRDGRPRFFAGPAARALGFKGQDLRHPDGRWFSLEECIAWSAARQDEIAERRRAIAAGETTARRTFNAVRRQASAGVVTVGQVCEAFLASPRMNGRAIVEGRRRREPLADNTARAYRGSARLIERFDDGAVWLSSAQELTAAALGGILHAVEVRHGLAQTRALRAFLSVAFRHGRKARPALVAHDPVGALEERLPTLEARVRPATVAQFLHMIDVADAIGLPDVGDMIAAGGWTAQRQNDRIAMTTAALTADGLLVEPLKKKRHGERLLLPVSRFLARRLEAARLRRRQWKVQPLALLPCERSGTRWQDDYYRKAYRVVRVAAATGRAERDEHGRPTPAALYIPGVPDIGRAMRARGLKPMPSLADLRDQDLRDTCLSWLPLAGCDKWEVAAFSGHAFGQSDKVLRHYVAVPPEFGRRAMAKLEAWFDAQLAALGRRPATGKSSSPA